MKTVRIASQTGIAFLLTMCSPVNEQQQLISQLNSRGNEMRMYAQKKGYSTQYCFLLDMRMHSGLKRFFVYDMINNSVTSSGLVAHGSCDQYYLESARFSNERGGGCTSIGIYKVAYKYYGQYGKSYKLKGLQNSNSNAFNRAVVLHSYQCVPDEESYPKPICNSLGCPMVSPVFFNTLSNYIEHSDKPLLLWVYN